MEIALIENIQREDLNAIEEAEAYLVLQEKFNLSPEKIAESVTIFFSDETNITHIQNLKVAGLKLEEETTKNVSNKLKDLIFVISGKFLNFSRDEIQNKIKLNGGKISKSLSSKTDFLISGENMGPKKKIKAKEIGTKIISEDDFISMI